jgi:hypothetical protein
MPRSGETAMIVKRQSLAAPHMKYRMQDCIDRYKKARVMIFFAGVALKFSQLKKAYQIESHKP